MQMTCFHSELYSEFPALHTITFRHSMICGACQKRITSAHKNAETLGVQPQLSEHILRRMCSLWSVA